MHRKQSCEWNLNYHPRYSFGYDSFATIPAWKDRITEPFGYFLSLLENVEKISVLWPPGIEPRSRQIWEMNGMTP